MSAYFTSTSGYTAATATTMAAALSNVLSGGTAAIDGGITSAYNTTGNPLIALGGFGGSTFPSGYLNYILFDENYVPIGAKSFPVQNLPSTRHTVQFDQPLEIKELGYVFVYLSYDNNQSSLYLYFDDLKVVVDESPVIQVNNYYPFGMVSNTWLREGEIDNAKLFQGKELIAQTGWHDFGSRMYWADLGRWFSTDPQKQFSSPYVGMGNMPVIGTDPNGEIFALIPFLLTVAKVYGYASTAYSLAQGYSQGGWEGLGRAFGSSAVSFGVGAVAGAALGGILPDLTNTMGAFKGAGLGGLSGTLGGGLAGGLTSAIGGGDFWEGFGNGALSGGITGALGGAYWGANNAYNAGKNVWWGNTVRKGRTQFSFTNQNGPITYKSPIEPIAGTIKDSCVPTNLQGIARSYGKPEDANFYINQYQRYKSNGSPFTGVHPNEVKGLVNSTVDLEASDMFYSQIPEAFNQGDRVMMAMDNYGSAGITRHAMNVQKFKVWADGQMKMRLTNPDGGGFFTVKGRTFSQYRFFRIGQKAPNWLWPWN